MKLTFISGVLVTVLMSCANGKEAAKTSTPQETVAKETINTNDSLYDRKWYLTKIHQDNTREVTERKAFIRFNREQGSAGGNGSCNSFGSTLKVDGKTISITEIFSTQMYCEGVQPIEDSFLAQLHKVIRYEIKGKTLSLFEKDKVVLEFEGE